MTDQATPRRVRMQAPEAPRISLASPLFSPRMDYDFARVLKDRKDLPKGSGEAIASALADNLEPIVRMSRYAARMSGIAARGVDVPTTYTVATGITPSIPDDDNGLTALFKKWSAVAGAEGVGDFFALQRLAFRETRIAGEVFAYLRYRVGKKAEDLPVPLQIQLIPSEMVPTETLFAPNARAGILFDREGDPAEYYLYKTHPGDATQSAKAVAKETVKVSASLLKHVRIQREAGALRGEPSLSRALVKLHTLEQYLGADLTRKLLNANIAYWLELPDLSEEEKERLADVFFDPSDGKFYDSDNNEVEPPKQYNPQVSQDGTVAQLPPGAKIKATDPADSGNTFAPFVREIKTHIAAGLGVPFEFLLFDAGHLQDRIYKGVSQQFEKQVSVWRADFISQFCNPIWNAFVRTAAAEGKWAPPAGKSLQDFLNPAWTGVPFPQLHYTQEVQGWTTEVEQGFATRSDIVRRKGDDPERVRKERQEDLRRDILAGLEPVPAHWTDKMVEEILGWSSEEVSAFRARTAPPPAS